MSFVDIPGNTRVKKILKLALQRGRVPNSLIFAGPEGVGKRRTALTLAKSLNCLELADDSCDRCVPCRAIDKGRFPDVMEIEAEKQEIKIEQIRFLKQMAVLKPLAGRRRVFIVDEAERMNAESANSLLKVLEEPPHFSHIVLVTASPFLLPPTIPSRCQTLAFSPVENEEIEKALFDKFALREAGDGTPLSDETVSVLRTRARILSLLVDGNLERALELEWDEVQALKVESWTLFEALLTGRGASGFLERFGNLPKPVHEEFARMMEVFASFARDMLLLQAGGDVRLLLNPDFEPRLGEAAGRVPASRLAGILAEIDFVLAELPKNLNKNLLLATFFSNMGELRHV